MARHVRAHSPVLTLLTLMSVALMPGAGRSVVAGTPASVWTSCLDSTRDNAALADPRTRLIADAQKFVNVPIIKRAIQYDDVGKNRTWLDGRALALAESPRQTWFALAMSDFAACRTISKELPLLACAYRFTGDEALRRRIVDQLDETARWSPLQRPGWTLYTPSSMPVPADFNDGNWLATGLGVRALAATLDIMPPKSLPEPLVQKVHALLRKEIARVVDDWKTKRSWFIRGNNPRTNQWVLPTEGLIRACLALGKEEYPEEYELGVRNLLAALDAQGPEGEFYEGIGYANFTVESMLYVAHAMAAAGDRRAIEHPFLRRFPTWMAHHLQPGRSRINCFDSGGARTPVTDPDFRHLLSLFVLLSGDPVANWCLHNQFSGPSDDWIGFLARAVDPKQQRAPCLFAYYPSATRVNWRGSWAEDATGVWIRGGHSRDGHDHFDRGHVNFIFHGKPILIEAGTPSYDNANLAKLYGSVVGHNVLEVPGAEAKKSPAPIAVSRLDSDGGELSVDASRGYPVPTRWVRKATWDSAHLEIADEVHFTPDKPQVALLRWHLGTQDDVEITGDEHHFAVSWKDAQFVWDSSSPVVLTTEMLPDNTVNLGQKVGPDFLHRCLVVRLAQPSHTWTLHTQVTGRLTPEHPKP